MRVVSAWICLVVSIFLLCSSTEAFWNKFIERRLVERKLQIERSTIGDWEEATLVEVDAPGPSKRDEPKWWFWKRQTGSTSGGNAGQPGGVPVATPGKQNLTGGPTTNTSGAAGNNTSGTTPGLIGNGDNPNERFVNCSDITTGRANKCWFDLNLTQYVNDWLDNAICVPGEGFASCFLRQNGFPGLDCSQISVSACPAPQSDSIITDPRRFYVAYNIYAINQFFYSWWTAVGSSGGIASNNIAQIVQIIDVPAETSVILQDILIALQSVFALIPGPLGIYAAHSAFSYQWQTAAQVISNAINVAPNVGRYLFPTDNTASQVVQLSQLSANFATVLQQVQSNLNQTLTSVMANVTEFLAFAEQGNFSAEAPSLPDQANYLYFAFNTYVISQALNGNNVYAVLGRGTNPQQLATNGTVTNYDINCDSYNDLNICDCWWYSTNYESAFTLDDFSKMNRNYNKQLNQLLQNLTTGRLLFEDAYECNSAGNFGQPVNITVTAKGVNTACISQLRVLTWDMNCYPGPSNCEFLEQPKQNTFGYNNVHSVTSQNWFSVPYGYLGPGISRASPKLKRD